MALNQTLIAILFQKLANGTASAEEIEQYYHLVKEPILETEIKDLMAAELAGTSLPDETDKGRIDRVYHSIQHTISAYRDKNSAHHTRLLWSRVAAIAAAVALIILGIYFFNYKNKATNEQTSAAVQDIAPGSVGATLTLASGKKIRLSNAANGELASETGISISKTKDGQLVYRISGTDTDPNKINTLSTANGETYQVHLPDGSLVYLNAASSLTYSASLIEHGKRKVKLIGEGYFEISKDKKHPFIVQTDKQEVEVLGTHFNINSYEDEPDIRTTLLEGSIRLNHNTILKPGEQSILNGSGAVSVEQVDVDNAVAWKNGYFQFENENLESIMRKVSRWYNVEVSYQDNALKKLAFMGTVSKYKNVSEILKTLQMTNELDFKIEGKRILINSHSNH